MKIFSGYECGDQIEDLYNISLDQLLKGDEAMMNIWKKYKHCKSNEKLIAAIIANVLLMILFILFLNGFIIENHTNQGQLDSALQQLLYAILSDYKETLGGMEMLIFAIFIFVFMVLVGGLTLSHQIFKLVALLMQRAEG